MLPSSVPNADNGTISRKNSTLMPGERTMPLCPRKSAAIRMNSSRITPDKSPAAQGASFDLFAEISPEAIAATQRRAAEKGTDSLAGSAVGKIAAVIKRAAASAQTSIAATTNAESFRRLKKPELSWDSRA